MCSDPLNCLYTRPFHQNILGEGGWLIMMARKNYSDINYFHRK